MLHTDAKLECTKVCSYGQGVTSRRNDDDQSDSTSIGSDVNDYGDARSYVSQTSYTQGTQ